MGTLQVLSLLVRVDMGVMALKGYSTLPRSPKLLPHPKMQFSGTPRTPLSKAENIYSFLASQKKKHLL